MSMIKLKQYGRSTPGLKLENELNFDNFTVGRSIGIVVCCVSFFFLTKRLFLDFSISNSRVLMKIDPYQFF